jgi:hypothetical protein
MTSLASGDWSRRCAWISWKGFTDRHPLVLVAPGSDAANMCRHGFESDGGGGGAAAAAAREGWAVLRGHVFGSMQ